MRYTYLVDIADLKETFNRFEKRTKYEIRKCGEKVSITNDIAKFNYFHQLSRPDRKINLAYIKKVFLEKSPNVRIYQTDTAAAMFSWQGKTAVYLLAGRDKTKKPDGSPSKIIWQAIQDFNKIGIRQLDLCGANKASIALFKRGFGGKLVEQKKFYLKY